MAFSIGGLASGLDTQSIIQQLLQIDARPKTQLEWKSQLWTARKNAWSDLNVKLQALQTQANQLMRVETWDVSAPATPGAPTTWKTTSGDPSRLGATVTGTPTAGTYAVEVLQLARAEVSTSTGQLGPATSGQRTTGAWYEAGTDNVVEGNENITALRTSTGLSLGLNTNSVITMHYTVDGVARTADFRVNTAANGGNGTNLADFAAWVGATIGDGASAQFLPSGYGADAGKLRVTTGAGTQLELDALSFTAVNAAGNPLVEFNSSVGAATSTQTVAATDGGVAGPDTLTITNGTGSWNVALAAGDQKQDIVDRINATPGIGVMASLVGDAIQLRSTSTGAAGAFTVSSTGTTAALLGFAETQSAQDAQYSVNGSLFSSATNMNVEGGIDGVALNLLGTTSTTLVLEESAADGSGGSAEDKWIKRTMDQLQAFVDAYNSVIQYVHQKTQGESRVVNPKNLQEYLQGSMARDVGMSQVALDLRRLATDVVSTLPGGANLLSDIGITSSFTPGAGATNGTLSIDRDKLESALRADAGQVRELLAGIGAGDGVTADDGILRRISETVSQLRVGGRVDNALQGANSRIKSIQDAIDRASHRLERRQAYYERMFASMETMMGRYQEQNSWLSGQFAALINGGSSR